MLNLNHLLMKNAVKLVKEFEYENSKFLNEEVGSGNEHAMEPIFMNMYVSEVESTLEKGMLERENQNGGNNNNENKKKFIPVPKK